MTEAGLSGLSGTVAENRPLQGAKASTFHTG